MSKVGILTQRLGWNYGAVLQNWALQQVLISLGYSPVTIKHYDGQWYMAYKWLRDIFVYSVKQAIHSPTRQFSKLPWDPSPFTNLYDFVKRHINITSYMPLKKSNELIKKGIDKIVVGSDQVWRPKYNDKKLKTLYCKFLNDDKNITAITYAASFGVSNWEYTESQTRMACEEIKKFRAVSVREASAIKLCQNYLHHDAELVLDPTLLLTKDDYRNLISERTIESLPEKYAAVYILDLSDQKRAFVETLCKKMGLKPFYFGNPDVDGKNIVGVETWLAAIMMSSYVITDSYHGTAFAINFRRPFISLVNYQRGADRFVSLLQMFRLENRLMDLSENQNVDHMPSDQIEWSKVEHVQNVERQKATVYLQKSLQL